MAEIVAIWEPTEYKSICPHCSAANFSKIPALHNVCTACAKEYLAKVAHTEDTTTAQHVVQSYIL